MSSASAYVGENIVSGIWSRLLARCRRNLHHVNANCYLLACFQPVSSIFPISRTNAKLGKFPLVGRCCCYPPSVGVLVWVALVMEKCCSGLLQALEAMPDLTERGLGNIFAQMLLSIAHCHSHTAGIRSVGKSTPDRFLKPFQRFVSIDTPT